MKKIALIITLAFLSLGAYAEKKEATFTVNPPLVCNNCETKVKENLRFEKGVKSVKPSAKKGIVEVTYDDTKTDVPTIIQGFKKIGYEATEYAAPCCEPAAPCCQPQAPCCQPEQKK